MHVPVHTSSIPCINRVIHAIAGKDLRVISFFDQLTHLRNYRQRSSGKRERERITNTKRRGIFLFLVGFRPTLDHDRVSRALSLLGRYLHGTIGVTSRGAPSCPARERLGPWSYDGRTTCFHSKVVATYQRSRGGYSGNKGVMVEGEGPWVGLRTCQYTRESQGSGPIRVRRPRRTDRSHTHAFLSSSASSLRPKVIYFYRATFDVSPSGLRISLSLS